VTEPAPVLEPAEVAALLGSTTAAPALPTPAGLERVAAQAAHHLAEGLGRCLGAPVRVTPAWVAAAHAADLAATLPDPTCAFLLRPRRRRRDDAGAIDPRQGRDGVTAVLELAPTLAHRCCARWVGVGGAPAPAAPDWRPGPTEWDVLDALAEGLALDLAPVLGQRLQLHGHASAPRLLTGFPPPVAACACEVVAPGVTALAHLWFAAAV
jgi:hypothetical protein